jgi:hypothetical protein
MTYTQISITKHRMVIVKLQIVFPFVESDRLGKPIVSELQNNAEEMSGIFIKA